MIDWLRPLLLMFYAPARGMAELRERAPLGPAVALALLAQGALLAYVLWPYLPGGPAAAGVAGALSVLWKAAGSVLFTAIVVVPVVIFVANLLERRASFGLALQQEYAAVASTVLYARAGAALVAFLLAVLWRTTGAEAWHLEQARVTYEGWAREGLITPEMLREAQNPLVQMEGLALMFVLPFFALWLLAAVREVFRFTWARAAVSVLASGLVMLPVMGLFGWLFGFVAAQPFLLLILFFLMRGYIGEVMRGQRARASFKQNLEASTLNPADASAHYNLGLIHLQRKELEEARARFRRAVEIDPDEVDSHYQLGRIARSQGRLPEAINHFGEVVSRDPAHAQQEVWREIGATYVAAGQFSDAQDALERFLEQRQSDPEGLYLMGRAHAGLGRTREAVQWMQRCVEAVRTAPAYKYRAEKRWLNEAQQFIRSQA